jgi:uncharacterized protein
MRIDERFAISAPIEKVWSFIRDPQTVAPCIPGCESVEALSANCYRSTVAVVLGPIKARFNVVVQITEEVPPNKIVCVTKGDEGSKASIVSARSEMRLTALDANTTEIACNSEVSVIGRLGKFGFGIMKKRASQIAAEFAAAVQQRMQSAHA